MTPAEMKTYFLAEYDAATSLSAPGWENSEITSFLNIAQDSIVTELYKVGDLTKLADIVFTESNKALFPHTYISNGMCMDVFSLDRYFHYVDSRTKVNRSDVSFTNSWLPNEFIQRVNASKFFLTDYNKVWFKYPKIFIDKFVSGEDSQTWLTILYDAYTTPLVGEITYIKRPIRIDITGNVATDLNESLHQAIVQLAVEQAVKSIKVAKISNQ